ncbi:hypothetical protein J6590_002702 [Homalodisca vitripennis]|nr:hypothetical protein J6590_002702 [Homalodisca vitripennis]
MDGLFALPRLGELYEYAKEEAISHFAHYSQLNIFIGVSCEIQQAGLRVPVNMTQKPRRRAAPTQLFYCGKVDKTRLVLYCM